jgi:thymidylate synthase
MDQVEEQLSRTTFSLPTLVINPDVDNLFDFVYEDFELQNYQSHGAISAPVAV